MRYVPNLIPKKSKVLPEYFKGNPHKPTTTSTSSKVVGVIISILLFWTSIDFFNHPVVFILFAIAGLIALPTSAKYIQNKLQFQLTSKIKYVSIALLVILGTPLGAHYIKKDKDIEIAKKLEEDKIERENLASQELSKRKHDTLQSIVTIVDSLSNKNQFQQADSLLRSAQAFVSNGNDEQDIKRQNQKIKKRRGIQLVESEKYREAIPILNDVHNEFPNDLEILNKRAVCLYKTGNVESAVQDLKYAISLGDNEAEKFHDKINPVKRIIIGYHTLCCDGSISYSKGRGTCSHHGGVCDWNDPEYDERRKYE